MCAETETDNMAGHVYQLMGYDSDTKKVRAVFPLVKSDPISPNSDLNQTSF